MNLTTIETWDTGVLDTVAKHLDVRSPDEIAAVLPTADGVAAWFGQPGGAALLDGRDPRDPNTAAALGAARRLAMDTSTAAAHLQSQLATLRGLAEAASLVVEPDGQVTTAPGAGPDAGRERLRSRLEFSARALIDQATAVTDEANRIVSAIRSGQITARGATTIPDAVAAGAALGGLMPGAPPRGATPAAVRAAWEALPRQQQRELISSHPEWLGNVPGIPSAVRHEVNVARLPGVRARLQEVADRLRAQVNRHFFKGWFTNEDAGLRQVCAKIADVEKLQELIGENSWSPQNPEGRMLLLLDMDSGEQGKAVVAIANPDDADHVSVTTPGMDTNIRNSFAGAIGETESLRHEAYRQLRLAGRDGQSVSTIMWLGYEPPDNRGSRLPGWSFLEVAQQDRATNGAPDLVAFYRGLDATSNKTDPHLVAFGHSYGSLTQGIALQQPGGHPVDDAAFYGSPGFEAGTEAELGLAPGHGYVMQGDRDWIAKFQSRRRFGLNGPAPLATTLRRLDVGPRTTPDGVEREGAHTHADYPRNGSNWQLRTSGYHLARILAGLPPD